MKRKENTSFPTPGPDDYFDLACYLIRGDTMKPKQVMLGECGPFTGWVDDDETHVPFFERDELERILHDLAAWNLWDWEWDNDTLTLRGGWGTSVFQPNKDGLYELLDQTWEFTVLP